MDATVVDSDRRKSRLSWKSFGTRTKLWIFLWSLTFAAVGCSACFWGLQRLSYQVTSDWLKPGAALPLMYVCGFLHLVMFPVWVSLSFFKPNPWNLLLFFLLVMPLVGEFSFGFYQLGLEFPKEQVKASGDRLIDAIEAYTATHAGEPPASLAELQKAMPEVSIKTGIARPAEFLYHPDEQRQFEQAYWSLELATILPDGKPESIYFMPGSALEDGDITFMWTSKDERLWYTLSASTEDVVDVQPGRRIDN